MLGKISIGFMCLQAKIHILKVLSEMDAGKNSSGELPSVTPKIEWDTSLGLVADNSKVVLRDQFRSMSMSGFQAGRHG
jgi:hypothetical protein